MFIFNLMGLMIKCRYHDVGCTQFYKYSFKSQFSAKHENNCFECPDCSTFQCPHCKKFVKNGSINQHNEQCAHYQTTIIFALGANANNAHPENNADNEVPRNNAGNPPPQVNAANAHEQIVEFRRGVLPPPRQRNFPAPGGVALFFDNLRDLM